MSVRAYRIIKIERAEEPSFNLWHDEELLDMLDDMNDQRNMDGNGFLEVPVHSLENAIANFPFEENDYRKEAIQADIAFAKENNNDYVLYECF